MNAIIHEALMTLPLGPEEHRDVWYANARLGVTVCRTRSAAKMQAAALRTKANKKAKTEFVKAHVA